MASLEQRIAGALAELETSAEQFAQLIVEAESAAQQAGIEAAKARERALDPTVVVDVAKVGAEVAAAELTRDRMNAALPKLRDAHRQACEREYAAAWYADLTATEGELDVLAAELAKVYPDCVQRLINILGQIPTMNARVAHINHNAPRGVGDRLQYVEQAARGVDGFGINGLLSLMTELKLPRFTFDDGGDRYQYSWPPPQPSLAAQMARTGGFAMGGAYVGADNWHDRIKQRDRQIVAEVEDAATKAEASKREREEKEKAEIAAAKERDRQAYRERGWPA